jgi:hypothetical protein
LKQLRKHLNVANVISCIALFVALSGAAYAAKATLGNKAVKTRNLANGAVSTLKLRSGAVTTLKLRNGAVTGAKIAPGAVGSNQLADGGVRSVDLGGGVVTEAKLKNSAVTESKLANNSVTNSKLAANSVTAGKIQDGAVTAAKLSAGFNAQLLKNVSYVTKSSPLVFPSDSAEVTAECPSGKQAIGGGAQVSIDTEKVALIASAPVVDGAGKRTGWTAAAAEFKEEAADWTLEVTAICAEF